MHFISVFLILIIVIMYFLKSSLNCDEFIRAIVASPDTADNAFYLQMQKGALDGVKIQTGGSECATQRKVGRKH